MHKRLSTHVPHAGRCKIMPYTEGYRTTIMVLPVSKFRQTNLSLRITDLFEKRKRGIENRQNEI
jgi:hypothetical protein